MDAKKKKENDYINQRFGYMNGDISWQISSIAAMQRERLVLWKNNFYEVERI